ncbi:hypothetical protein PC117_g1491 [Phytophthora cactorum]|uniref:Protein kinase domain-containing protein n=1 Tax=Phytophthora cactorum TaxID=29920 RepID=A0A8T1EQA6_9STRA|nr:hypothetical protein PC117_g1491 [Phytophthora cactorum]
MRFARLRGNPPAKSVLTDIRSRCKWLPELEKLCLRAVDRLEALHDEVAQCREDDPPRVKYIDTVVILLDRIIRRKPLLTRLARFHSVTLIIRGLHQDLDEVETGLGTSIEGNEWRDQWERDRTEQFSILEQLVQNTTDRQLVREIKSEKVVEQVLMELHKELVECPLETHWQLMRATFDRVCAFARLNGIQYPDWYISADDLMFEEGPGVAGTFGEVRRATWFHGGERTCVIVKQLFQDSSLESDQDTFEQFERWKNLSGCDHILTFHGGSHASKPQFFVCEYAPYGNLRGFLTDEKNETMMWPLFLQAAEGLKALHSHGIVHGALKCSNILVDANYTAKLADFGFASARMHAMELNSVAATAIGSAVRWKPKEILEYSDMTGPQFQADTYSLGMCMIEALTHQAPFSMVGDDTEAVEMILHGESHPRPDGVSDAVWNLISQLSEPDSAKRPTLDMAIEMIRELIKMQAKEKESDIMASIAGMTAIKSTEEAGTVPGEMVKTEVFCSWEADGSIVTTTVRTTTCTRTSASGELITEVTNTETEVTTETTETTEETVEEVTEETMEGTQGTITTTETTEVTEVTTIETITEEADAGSEDGMESSAALVASDTAAMSSLYARYAHESPTMSGAASRGSVMPMTQGQSRTQRTCKDDHGKLSGFMLSFKQSWDSPEEEPTADSEHSVPSCVNGHHVGFESDVYWLGQCIVDVFCGQSMANNRVDTAMRCDGCNTNPLLHRPEELTDTEWQLIKDMCAAEPSSRIDMPDVVERLARLIAVDAVIDQLASSSSQYLDCSKRNRGQSNLLTVMSSYTTTSGQSNLLMSCYATGYDTNSDLDYDSFSDSLELSQETVKGGVLEVKFEELTQVDSFDRSAEDAVKERYRDDLETLLNAEEKGSSSSNGLLMASAQPRKLYGRLRCLPPDPISPQWILSTDHIAESTWRESDLGSGSFAAVCRGAWLGAPVALKKLKKFDLKSAQTLREEANIWFTLRHPNIVSLFGASTRGYPLFVCEYIDGQRLDECRKGEAKVSDEEIWGYLHDAAVGLQGLHMHGVVHADLKCDNILIGAEGRAKLIDFGLSCLQTCDGGAPLGAKQWKAPECLQGAGPTFESDIYGFGMCIIQAFAGKCPWGQIPDQAVAVHVANGRLPSKPATLTQLQWEAIRKMCRQDPQARLQLDFVVRVLGFFAGHLPYIDDATLQEEFSSWTSTTE